MMASRITPRIFTAAWSTKLPHDVVRIGVSRGPPRRQSGFRRLKELEPGAWFRTTSDAEFIALYRAQLTMLEPERVLQRVQALAAGAPCAALLCFERPFTGDTWCHRSLVAQWLYETLDIEVCEWGWEHLKVQPMLPPSLRERTATEYPGGP